MKNKLPLYFLFMLLFAGSCNRTDSANGNKVDKTELIAALNDFKKAVVTKDTNRLSKFIPSATLEQECSDSFFINTLNNFFKYLDMRGLKTSDTISKTLAMEGELCIDKYAISVAADSVTFEHKMDSNPTYKLTTKDEEEGIDQSAECEHVLWCNFKIIKGKLQLTSISGAD